MPTQLSADAEVPEIRVKTAYNGYVSYVRWYLLWKMWWVPETISRYDTVIYFIPFRYVEVQIVLHVIGYDVTLTFLSSVKCKTF
jgi:hypothetical protein